MTRTGIGYDIHRLVQGRPLILGGTTIPYEKGLLGHSDADVLVHAACDALLGAVGMGDMGEHFPDTDLTWKDTSSMVFLDEIYRKILASGWELVNMDATVFAQAPKLSAHKPAMARNMAQCMGVSDDRINIKATTTEGLGVIGAGAGMAAMCVVLLQSPYPNSAPEAARGVND
ncbi:2-C-methyl-D-erythritol 2,4-cyclodiphosphate synthase [Desulfosarcina sp. OttesenSCG-928-A07]|nr:2-C-methyl-D-erythritol 2,4-cyclodiphosphate synthase [Desulfosarcina sp. OttesenSCG-928-G17]MDL2328803.1 2-C-methyl-D-erythritol 2,4-cyclodiphosphate synthase [Desulfosarcina sp. OttesenSCG-928-A07]